MKGVLSHFSNYGISALNNYLGRTIDGEDPYYSLNTHSHHNNNEKPDTYYYILNEGFYAVGF